MEFVLIFALSALFVGARAQERGMTFDLGTMMSDPVSHFTTQCADKFGKTHADKLKNEVDSYYECIFSRVSEALSADLSAVVGGYENIVPIVCQKIDGLRKCGRPVITALKSCTTPAGSRDVDRMETAIFRVAQYLCHDRGYRIIEFAKGEGIECLTAERSALHRCSNSSFESMKSIEQGIFTTQFCAIYKNSTSCAINVLRKCRTQTPAALAQQLKDIVFNETCQLSSATKSIASSSLVVLVALLCSKNLFSTHT